MPRFLPLQVCDWQMIGSCHVGSLCCRSRPHHLYSQQWFMVLSLRGKGRGQTKTSWFSPRGLLCFSVSFRSLSQCWWSTKHRPSSKLDWPMVPSWRGWKGLMLEPLVHPQAGQPQVLPKGNPVWCGDSSARTFWNKAHGKPSVGCWCRRGARWGGKFCVDGCQQQHWMPLVWNAALSRRFLGMGQLMAWSV